MTRLYFLAAIFLIGASRVFGCSDENACNYDPGDSCSPCVYPVDNEIPVTLMMNFDSDIYLSDDQSPHSLTFHQQSDNQDMIPRTFVFGIGCADTSDGATDERGLGCEDYDYNPDHCGQRDTSGFTASAMCCACGGGTTPGYCQEDERNDDGSCPLISTSYSLCVRTDVETHITLNDGDEDSDYVPGGSSWELVRRDDGEKLAGDDSYYFDRYPQTLHSWSKKAKYCVSDFGNCKEGCDDIDQCMFDPDVTASNHFYCAPEWPRNNYRPIKLVLQTESENGGWNGQILRFSNMAYTLPNGAQLKEYYFCVSTFHEYDLTISFGDNTDEFQRTSWKLFDRFTDETIVGDKYTDLLEIPADDISYCIPDYGYVNGNACKLGCNRVDDCNYHPGAINDRLCVGPPGEHEIPVTLTVNLSSMSWLSHHSFYVSSFYFSSGAKAELHSERTFAVQKYHDMDMTSTSFNFCINSTLFTEISFNANDLSSMDGFNLATRDEESTTLVSFPAWNKFSDGVPEYKICVPGGNNGCEVGCGKRDACNYRETTAGHSESMCLYPEANEIPVTLELSDRLGDGRKGHGIEFEQTDGSKKKFTIAYKQKTYNFCLPTDSYTKVTVSNEIKHTSQDHNEVRWSLLNRASGVELIGDDYSDGYLYERGTPDITEYCVPIHDTCVIGCSDEDACNYDPDASKITSNLWRQNCPLGDYSYYLPLTLELNGRWGDGWQGHSIVFEQEDGSTNTYTIEEQESSNSPDPIQKTYNFCLDLTSYTKVTVHKGSDSQEVHWSLMSRVDQYWELIGDDYSDGFFDGEDAPSEIEYCVEMGVVKTCVIGCADENACDYDPDASKISSNLWRQNCEFQLECALQSSLLWSEQGSKIEGSSDNERLGVDVSLSSDGTRIAVSGGTTNKGYVRMYEYDEEWTLMNATESLSVFLDAVPAVSLSKNGDHVAVGNRFASSKFGTVTVYKYHDGIWGQIGQTLKGTTLWRKKWKGKGQFGNSVALSQNGIRMVVGAPMYKNRVSNVKGFASVFNYNSETQQWVQIGETIEGMGNSKFGTSVSISSNGDVIAISGPGARDPETKRGYVGVYQYNQTESEWVRMGPFIENVNADETKPDQFGMKVSLSATGTRVAVGAPKNKGFVYVFDYDSSNDTWVQVGTKLSGKERGDLFGTSVSLSDDGLRLAVGAKKYDEPNDDSGQVRMYIFDGTDWVQIGMDVNGERLKDQFGTSVSITSDGTRVAVGAPYADKRPSTGKKTNNVGHVRVHYLTCGADTYVFSNTCRACPPGTTNAPGDDILGADTTCDAILCNENEYVSSHVCTLCPTGRANAPGDDASGSDTLCDLKILCDENQYVSSNVCMQCPPGTENDEGDDASGSDTLCDPILCDENQYVSSNVCTQCPPSTENDEGDDASGSDTLCDLKILCDENEYVSSNVCRQCPTGTTNAPGDLANGADTMCDGCMDSNACNFVPIDDALVVSDVPEFNPTCTYPQADQVPYKLVIQDDPTNRVMQKNDYSFRINQMCPYKTTFFEIRENDPARKEFYGCFNSNNDNDGITYQLIVSPNFVYSSNETLSWELSDRRNGNRIVWGDTTEMPAIRKRFSIRNNSITSIRSKDCTVHPSSNDDVGLGVPDQTWETYPCNLSESILFKLFVEEEGRTVVDQPASISVHVDGTGVTEYIPTYDSTTGKRSETFEFCLPLNTKIRLAANPSMTYAPRRKNTGWTLDAVTPSSGNNEMIISSWYSNNPTLTTLIYQEFSITRTDLSRVFCEDTNDGALNIDGDGCDFYDRAPGACDETVDTLDFTASAMCCACGGGSTGSGEGTPSPTPSPSNFCEDTDDGALDTDGDGCDFYDRAPDSFFACSLGDWDDSDFTASTMCCACGGGRIAFEIAFSDERSCAY